MGLLMAGGCAGSQTAAGSAAWYSRSVAVDLNGDRRLDRVVLTARGHRSDSLDVEIAFFVGDRQVHGEGWSSDYELVDVEPTVLAEPRRGEYVRTRLDRALNSVTVGPIDTATYLLMGEDTTVLGRVNPVPAEQVSFNYGYETSVVLVWDRASRMLVPLWICC